MEYYERMKKINGVSLAIEFVKSVPGLMTITTTVFIICYVYVLNTLPFSVGEKKTKSMRVKNITWGRRRRRYRIAVKRGGGGGVGVAACGDLRHTRECAFIKSS